GKGGGGGILAAGDKEDRQALARQIVFDRIGEHGPGGSDAANEVADIETQIVGHLTANAHAVGDDPLVVDGVLRHHVLRDLLDKLRFAGEPAPFTLGPRAQQDDVIVAAKIVPGTDHVLGVFILAFAGGVQPNHQRISNVGIVVFGNVDPVLVVARLGRALEQTSFRFLLFIFLVVLLLLLFLGRRRLSRPDRARLARRRR